MKVDIWSDVRCPFCYIGKRKFEKALEHFPQRDKLEVEWHSFELDPGLKTDTATNVYDHLARVKNISPETSVQLHRHVTEMAEKSGLEYNFDKAVIANSFDAHRLVQLAKQHRLGDEAEEKLFKAYFTEGKDISDHLTLIILGQEIGLDGKEIKQMLDTDAFADEVRYEEKQAREIGINGVPFFVINDKYAVSGAQEPEVFVRALSQGWREYEKENPELKTIATGAETCGPDGNC
ncbi:MAG TPA: DsbA family oxidoreductase [Chitinophagaceae bacterium]|nr:DsbA family oxidoreductase [Chitinophagaceae bacterium]